MALSAISKSMDIDIQAEVLAQKIRHFIITNSGKVSQEASIEDFYQAFCLSLREELMIHWAATFKTVEKKRPRIAYFLSMEYMPGRLLGNNITNLGAQELVKAVLVKTGRNFSELAACEPDAGLGNGGLGRLSSCFLDSLATGKYPSRGYGLRYQYGIFEQEIWNGMQVEKPDCWLLNLDPWEVRKDTYAMAVNFGGKAIFAKNKHGDEVALLENAEEVRALPYDIPIVGYSATPSMSVLSLRLWSTKESPRNFELQRYNAGLLDQASENTSLTDVLYPNDNNEMGKRVRLKQEFLLVSASLQDIIRRHKHVYGDLSEFADKVRIQINDTHPALVIAELIRTLTKNYDFSWGEAVEICKTCCSYTNHTILREGLEEWKETRMAELLPRQYHVIQKLNLDFCNQVRKKFPGDEEKVRRLSIIENGQIRMAYLAILGSHKINGVAQLHSELLKKHLFADFYDIFPDRFVNVTNGITQRRWLLHANPRLAQFISHRIGPGWVTRLEELEKLKPFADDPASQKEFLAIKKSNKEDLLHFLNRENPLRDAAGKVIAPPCLLGSESLFDVQIKRIHEYKRQLMAALHLIWVYQELLDNPQARTIPRFALFGGKAAPGYIRAKQIIQLLYAIGRTFHSQPEIHRLLSVVFIENYNVSKAEIIIPAADLSEQISAAGWEASGTGNMKLSLNGALTIGTEDGANIEMRKAIGDQWWLFRFGATVEENRQSYNPWDIYSTDEPIRRAVDALRNGAFAKTSEEAAAFEQIYQGLTESDPFRVLQDLRSYYETQKRVEELYQNPQRWAQAALHNIAGMGSFSTDTAIRHYARDIWQIEPCPPDPEVLEQIRREYAEHDRCRLR
jgi:starch phosphorylase